MRYTTDEYGRECVNGFTAIGNQHEMMRQQLNVFFGERSEEDMSDDESQFSDSNDYEMQRSHRAVIFQDMADPLSEEADAERNDTLRENNCS